LAHGGSWVVHHVTEAGDLDALRSVTAGLAHEVRNPLQFIKNYAEVVTELSSELDVIVAECGPDVPASLVDDLASLRTELGQAGEQIERHVRRLDAIVESMLAATQQARGQRQLTDVNLLVTEAAEYAYHGRAGSHRAPRDERLVLELDRELPLAVVDPLRLSRAVVNLVTNALQAAGDGGSGPEEPTVVVSTAPTPTGFSIVVRDNGPGIPAELRGRVFEPFLTAKRGRHHAGLGLTQVWEIVVGDHHGTVTIDSDDTGTVATIAVPNGDAST
jgi:signal transduction histidine kinase